MLVKNHETSDVCDIIRGKIYKIPRKYFMNSAADLSKFCSNSAEIILSLYINYE